ncbi:MAG: tRNA uridine(34) 5-carboxymethylaminomethyl modification radical SAM/GNAT enzyme Elp3 [Candidatus Aenigmarchaeota archaeon]|nr:tRNA uridine(34) 5-carboxymethylaminomethyl modification radical SAM/GNAT enzyme Elp3 [Candidatus Aenigmarchaeota archaeon]
MQAALEIISKIESGQITSRYKLEREKIKMSVKYGMDGILKNAQIIPFASNADTIKFLQMKPVRTASGVATIAVMWKYNNVAGPCPANCVYCPKGSGVTDRKIWNAPKAYTGTEPTTQRAIRFDYDPYLQIQNRLMQFRIMGHPSDKCELIIMGGTFTSIPFAAQEEFIKQCFDSFNGQISKTLHDAQKINETAKNRCIGLTIETRADYCDQQTIEKMLSFGTTRVEIGVQSTSDEILTLINRGHDSQENINTFARLRNNGLKITAHWMPGLTGLYGKLDMQKEVESFKKLFTEDYQPDEIKIYPALVIEGTKLNELWKQGKYEPLTDESFIELLTKLKQHVPPHVRIKNVMRDIPHTEATAGASRTNLRQLTNRKMAEQGLRCNCIRCREVGLAKKIPDRAEMIIEKFRASDGDEYFISIEDSKQSLLLGFIRLRITNNNAFIRELHVYGKLVPIGEKNNSGGSDATGVLAFQHRGIGRQLLQKAEEICISSGIKKLLVTSGVGVREYYHKLGYKLEGCYMVKNL